MVKACGEGERLEGAGAGHPVDMGPPLCSPRLPAAKGPPCVRASCPTRPVCLGPCVQTPWEGGTFKLVIEFSEDYPTRPPSCELWG
jgi:hypothetical protein